MACSNATRHSKSSQHELNLDQFHSLLRRQLDRSHTHAIGYLGLGGSSGHMFAITLCSHGYTFVGKGSRSDQVPTLAHELGIYETIHSLQGNSIPVCLGLLELEGPYCLPSPNHLTHFLLLSFGGFRLSRRSKLLPPAVDIISSARTALKKLHAFNLTHCDLRAKNLRWSTELQCVIKPGDQICVFYGADTPFILRPSANDGFYRFVGECYVHGLLDGEAVVMKDEKHTREGDIIIQ